MQDFVHAGAGRNEPAQQKLEILSSFYHSVVVEMAENQGDEALLLLLLLLLLVVPLWSCLLQEKRREDLIRVKENTIIKKEPSPEGGQDWPVSHHWNST